MRLLRVTRTAVAVQWVAKLISCLSLYVLGIIIFGMHVTLLYISSISAKIIHVLDVTAVLQYS